MIKPHTDFEHEFESGLLKMMAIGLGKEKGASIYHRAIMTYGYPRVVLSVARQVLDTGKIICGVGIVENGYAQTARILGADEIITEEKVLLEEARRLAPALPFEDVDVLIIDEIGKDISGTGFDTKVVGRVLMPLITKEPETPRVKRIVVCDLTSKSQGNAGQNRFRRTSRQCPRWWRAGTREDTHDVEGPQKGYPIGHGECGVDPGE